MTKSDPKLVFLPFSQVWLINCNNFHEIQFKIHEKNFVNPKFGQRCQNCVKKKLLLPFSRMMRTPNWVRNKGFCHFFKVASSLFLDIAQDCSFGQCLTSSRAETSKKKKKKKKKKNCDPILGWNYIFYSIAVERPLKLSCYLLQKAYY